MPLLVGEPVRIPLDAGGELPRRSDPLAHRTGRRPEPHKEQWPSPL
ncbi:hypothetical protein ACQEXF_38975 [Streptomyces sp. CA-106131]